MGKTVPELSTTSAEPARPWTACFLRTAREFRASVIVSPEVPRCFQPISLDLSVISNLSVALPLHLLGSPDQQVDQAGSENAGRRDGRRTPVAKEDRGFASMDRAKQREIASKGGKAAHQKGTAHEWTSEEARDAGRKGGLASHRRRREQMSANTGGTTEDRHEQIENRASDSSSSAMSPSSSGSSE